MSYLLGDLVALVASGQTPVDHDLFISDKLAHESFSDGGDFPLAVGGAIGGALCARCHENPSESFGALEQSGKRPDAFARECLDCHAVCGTCHGDMPYVDDDGLLNNHIFVENEKMKIDNVETCIPCHHLVADRFYGERMNHHVRPGIDSDWLACHSVGQKIHGRGGPLDGGSKEKPMADEVISAKCGLCHAVDTVRQVGRD